MMFRTNRNGLQSTAILKALRKSAGVTHPANRHQSPGAALEQNGSPASRAAQVVAAILAAIENTPFIASRGNWQAWGVRRIQPQVRRSAARPCIVMG
jgi:hypothetical protein